MQPDIDITSRAATSASRCRLFVAGLRESDESALERALRRHGATNAHVRIDARAPAIHCVWTRRLGKRTSCGNFVLRFRPCPQALCSHLPAAGAPGVSGHQALWIDEPVLASDDDAADGTTEGSVELSQLLIEALMDCMPTHQWAWVLLPPELALNAATPAARDSRTAVRATHENGFRNGMVRTAFSTALAFMALLALIVGNGLAH